MAGYMITPKSFLVVNGPPSTVVAKHIDLQRAVSFHVTRSQEGQSTIFGILATGAVVAGVLGSTSQTSKRSQRHLRVRKQAATHTRSQALIFDCDGVIAESEHLHRDAYNEVFKEFELGVTWSDEYYEQLQNSIGGGKPKMRHHFNTNGWPSSKLGPAPTTDEEKTKLIDALQDRKTRIYTSYIASGRCCARPGILALIDSALARSDLKTAICSASTKEAALEVLNAVLGKKRLEQFDVVLLGDDVKTKKPDPEIYRLAAVKLGLEPSNCSVIEDSKIGLQSALGAGMNCYITYTNSTKNQDFAGAKGMVADATALSVDKLFPVA